MVVITLHIPEDQAVLFAATAREQDLSLEEWLLQLAELEVKTKQARRFKLEERLALCDPNAPLSEEELEWLNAPRVGREVI